MNHCALRFILAALSFLVLMTIHPSAMACFGGYDAKSQNIPIALSSTQKEMLYVSSYRTEEAADSQRVCNASISVPLSLYPTARLVARPADFASDLREVMKEWELEEEETCITELFRYDGDSLWSASSEESCFSDAILL